MLQVHDKQAFHDDGTPRRKYEIEGDKDQRVGLRVAVGLAIFNVIAFVKDVLSSKPLAGEAPEDAALDDSRGGDVADGSDEAPERLAEDSQPAQDRPAMSSSSPPLAFRASMSAIFNVSLDSSEAVAGRRANDNSPIHDPATAQAGQFTFTTTEPVIRFPDGQAPLVDDSKTDPKGATVNRRPVTTGTLSLGMIMLNAHMMIAVADLLQKASDPDGDRLAVHDLSASSGTLTLNADGSWHYLAAYDDERPVVFTYRISDGEADVWQTAVLNVDPHAVNQIDGTVGGDDILGSVGNDLIRADGDDDLILARGGDDVIHGGDGNDRIEAGAGNDVVFAGAGDDFVLAGDGDDTVFGEEGHDTLFGEGGDDVLSGNAGNDALHGGSGSDILDGGAGDDAIYAGDGSDMIILSMGHDEISGGADIDTLDAGSAAAALQVNLDVGTLHGSEGSTASMTGIENIVTGSGDDHVTGSGADNIIVTGSGDDTVVATAGHDAVDGGTGTDTFDASAVTADVAGNLDTGTVAQSDGASATLVSIENIATGSGNDHVTGSGADNDITTGSGADIITASAGNDRIDAGDGIDTYDASAATTNVSADLDAGTVSQAGAGDTTLIAVENIVTGSGDDVVVGSANENTIDTGSGDDQVAAGAGNDVVVASAGNDSIDGGDGQDTYDAAASTRDVTITLTTGTASGDDVGRDTVRSVEIVITGLGNDIVTGDSAANTISTGEGHDTIDAGGGADTVHAGAGSDTIVLHLDDARDRVDGGEGVDMLDMSDFIVDLCIDLAQGFVAAAQDMDLIDDIENVRSGGGNDRIIANNDINVLFGGEGSDIFVFLSSEAMGCGRGSRDRIMDFEIGDQIDFAQLAEEFRDSSGGSGNSSDFRFVLLTDGMKFANPGELRFQYDEFEGSPRVVVLEGNMDGDEDAEFQIELTGDMETIASYFATAWARDEDRATVN